MSQNGDPTLKACLEDAVNVKVTIASDDTVSGEA